MLFSFVLVTGLIVTVIAVVAVLLLRSDASTSSQTFAVIRANLLLVAGILSGLMMLLILVVAAWGMDTRPPWGLGIYMYLIPALGLPAFLLLKFSVRTLSRVLWLLTISNALAWFFGDRAVRITSGMAPLSDPREITGMFLNAFTLLYLIISVLVQLAELSRCKGHAESPSAQEVE